MNLSSKIKEICLAAGFFKCGFTDISEIHSERDYLSLWLTEKKQAGMDWMERTFEKRINPLLVMPEAKSVISLAFIYDTPFTHKEGEIIPKISRYAYGDSDYHNILKKKLKEICRQIELLDEGIKTLYYVDDGPVMEKVWAQRAGIGWMGKHTNILNEEAGSFFFLSEILINKKLESDIPAEDLCGGCTLCVQACPTGAIESEYKLNPELCISYQTIENKEEIPSYIDIAGWIYGCDICQDVCPYNRKKFFTSEESFYPKDKYFNKDISVYDSISEDEFKEDFRATPLKRLKYNRWRRNIDRFKLNLNKKD